MANYRKSRIAAHILFFVTILGLTIAYAGEYHAIKEKTQGTAETLACSQCHTMHNSQGRVSMQYSGLATPQAKLLRHSSILQLCLYCHDNNQAGFSCAANTPCPPDVWIGTGTGRVQSGGSTVNSAGLLCAGGSSGTMPCSGGTSSDKTNHTVNVGASVVPPGGSVTLADFTCVNCHNPHGTKSFRNLRDNGTSYAGITFMSAGNTVSYSMGVAGDNTKYVNNLVAAGFGLAKYATTAVTFRAVPTARELGMQGFCRSCHTLFHGASGSAEMGGSTSGDNTTAAADTWTRHPVMDVTMGEGQASTNLHVADAAFWGGVTLSTSIRIINPDGVATGNTDDMPFCLSCHRAHGSGRHSNLIFGNPATSVDGAGTYMRDTCNQCHNQ